MRALFLILLTLFLVTVGWFLADGDTLEGLGGPGPTSLPEDSGGGELQGPISPALDQRNLALVPEDHPAVRESVGTGEVQVSPEVTPEDEAPTLIYGRVIDQQGNPLEEVHVRLVALGRNAPGGSGDFFLNSRSGWRLAQGPLVEGVSNRSGDFIFKVSGSTSGLSIECGRRLLRDPLRVPVDMNLSEQIIALPGPPQDAGQIRVMLFDLKDQPLRIKRIESRLIRPAEAASDFSPVNFMLEHNDARSMYGGNERTLVELAPGEWHIWVWPRGGGMTSGVVKLAPKEKLDWVVRWPRRAFTGIENYPILATPDKTNGMATRVIKGQKPRALGEHGFNAYLRHTFHFPAGELSSAFLLLDLEAESGGADNDSINLEYHEELGVVRWGWSSQIAKLPGATLPWRNHARGHLELDLSQLPLSNGAHRSLLDSMADGKLDIWIQDDTFVQGMCLTVVHK